MAKLSPWPFDKYELYSKAVQSPDADVEFFDEVFREHRGRRARILREDFCGTFMLSLEWLKLNAQNSAFGVDVDPEPISYGRENYLSQLPSSVQKRMHILEKSVLDSSLPQVEVSVAMNFSYFLFKQRKELKAYFQNVFDHLLKDGIFILDIFGGSQCQDEIEDRTPKKGFVYYWDQKGFDPITNEAKFEIHFKIGKKKHKGVFRYDWRMWSIPEVCDILKEVGFKSSHVYWEGTAKDGSGSGVFKRAAKGEPCLSWISYIVGLK